VGPLQSLTNLTTLSLRYCEQLSDVGPLQSLTNLTTLYLRGCKQLSDVGPLQSLTNLTTLDLGGTNVSDVGPLQSLTNLTRLNLGKCNQLSDVGPLQSLTNLTTLNLSWWRQLSDVGPLQSLTNLTTLNLGGTNLSDVGPLKSLTKLTMLNLGSTNVSDVGLLQSLTNLTTLDLDSCRQLSDVGPLQSLTNLTTLDLNYSRAPKFGSLHELPNLQELKVYQSRFADLHPAVCGNSNSDNSLESVRQYYAALGNDPKPDAEIKVFVLGNGRAGKTKLVGRMMGRDYDSVSGITTHGVKIASYPAPDFWGLPHPVTLSIWDFGGQDIYHGTHALFIREPAIYLLLYAKGTENEDTILEGGFTMQNRLLPYWFDYLRQEAGSKGVVKSPVMFIQSQCDKDGELPEPKDRPPAKQFPQLTQIIHSSSKANDCLDFLMPRLKKAIKDLLNAHPQPPFPKTWDDVRQAIRRMQNDKTQPLLAQEEFVELCEQHDCGNNAEVLRDALNLMGVIFYRKGIFSDRIIVDQTWVLDKVYTVFTRHEEFQQEIRDKHGKFRRSDLHRYFWRNEVIEDQRMYLSFMEQCGICFRTEKETKSEYEGRYIAPDLLPRWENGPAKDFASWPKNIDAGVTATFRLLHDGIARSFLAKIGKQAGDRADYWRYGCHFRDATTQSELLIRTTGNSIRMEAIHGDAAKLLQTLVEVLQKVPCGQPPEIAWDEAADMPTIVDRDDKPEQRLNIVYLKRVFISYSHEPASTAFVIGLVPVLRKKDWHVIWDQEHLQDGDRISTFCQQVRAVPFLLPVIAEQYLRKLWCLTEFFSFWESKGSLLKDFGRFSNAAADTGTISPQHAIAQHVRTCEQHFTQYVETHGDYLDSHTKEQIAQILRWTQPIARTPSKLSDMLNLFAADLTTIGFAELKANNYAAVVNTLERKYAAANSR